MHPLGVAVCFLVLNAAAALAAADPPPESGLASWYGEALRGRLMANGKPFNPHQLTAASWFYPLGTRVRVLAMAPGHSPRAISVLVTDRGPSRRQLHRGVIIDLSYAAFKALAPPEQGIARVKVQLEGTPK